MDQKHTTAKEVKKLLEDERIYDSTGSISINLFGSSVRIKQKDIVGNALQEWLGAYLKNHGYYLREAVGQTFPDFYFSENDNENLCEMKSFLHGRSPAFDIAFFSAYIESLRTHPHRLNSDYLIFSYDMDDDGNISIKNIWCKKVWEITGSTEEYTLNCQRKRGQIVNIPQ